MGRRLPLLRVTQLILSLPAREQAMKNANLLAVIQGKNMLSAQQGAAATNMAIENWFLTSAMPFLRPDYE